MNAKVNAPVELEFISGNSTKNSDGRTLVHAFEKGNRLPLCRRDVGQDRRTHHLGELTCKACRIRLKMNKYKKILPELKQARREFITAMEPLDMKALWEHHHADYVADCIKNHEAVAYPENATQMRQDIFEAEGLEV